MPAPLRHFFYKRPDVVQNFLGGFIHKNQCFLGKRPPPSLPFVYYPGNHPLEARIFQQRARSG